MFIIKQTLWLHYKEASSFGVKRLPSEGKWNDMLKRVRMMSVEMLCVVVCVIDWLNPVAGGRDFHVCCGGIKGVRAFSVSL